MLYSVVSFHSRLVLFPDLALLRLSLGRGRFLYVSVEGRVVDSLLGDIWEGK